MQHVKWPKAYVAGVSMVPTFSVLSSQSLTNSCRLVQGGGILAAFTSFFPDLVDSKVAFVAPTGLVEVSSSFMRTACYLVISLAINLAPSLKICQKQPNSYRPLSLNS